MNRVSERALPWAFAGVAALIGIPLLRGRRGAARPDRAPRHRTTRLPLLKIGIPALAGLSVLHGFVPPHPGPLLAIATLKADLGLTLAFGLVLAIPAVVLARPVYGSFISRYLDLPARRTLFAPQASRELAALGSGGTSTTVAGAPDDLDAVDPTPAPVRRALLTGTIVAMFTPGVGSCMSRERIAASLGGALGPIAGILLIVAAGGGFKQTPVDAGVGNVIADWATGANISALLLGWLVAVGIRPAALVAFRHWFAPELEATARGPRGAGRYLPAWVRSRWLRRRGSVGARRPRICR